MCLLPTGMSLKRCSSLAMNVVWVKIDSLKNYMYILCLRSNKYLDKLEILNIAYHYTVLFCRKCIIINIDYTILGGKLKK